MKAVSLRIEGGVQGVGYRFSARREAIRLGVSGWVTNEDDGSVAAFAEGDAGAVDAFVAWCRRGPRGAQVERVDVVPGTPRGTGDFRIK